MSSSQVFKLWIEPFPGARPFELWQADYFFGREDEVREVLRRLSTCRALRPFAFVKGDSGVGKTSLVIGGIAPEIQKGRGPDPGCVWSLVVFKPGFKPIDNLARSLATEWGPDWNAEALKIEIREKGLAQVVRRWASAADQQPPRRLLILIDGLEETVTLTNANVALEFGEMIAAALRDATAPLAAIATCRPEFVAGLSCLGSLAAILGEHQYQLLPLRGARLRRIIKEPARRAGLRWEEGLLEHVCQRAESTVRAAEDLPLLAHALQQLWLSCQETKLLTYQAFDAQGSMEDFLVRSANDALKMFAPRLEDQDRARRLFLSLIRLGQGIPTSRGGLSLRDARAICGGDELYLNLAEQRLIRLSETEVFISHEVLIRKWGTLHNWISGSRAVLSRRDAVDDAAGAWAAAGRPRRDLPTGDLLGYFVGKTGADTLTTEQRKELSESYSPLGRSYLEAAERAARRRSLRMRLVIGALAITALFMTTLALWASWQNRRAGEAQKAAEQRLLNALKVANEWIEMDFHLREIAGADKVRERFLESSANLLEQLLRDAKEAPLVLYSRAVCRLAQGELETIYRRNPSAHARFEDARQLLDKLLLQDAQNFTYRRLLAQAYMGLGKTDAIERQARAAYDKASMLQQDLLKTNPQDEELITDWVDTCEARGGSALWTQMDLHAARKLMTEMRLRSEWLRENAPPERRGPRQLRVALARLRLGDISLEEGRLEEARQWYQRAEDSLRTSGALAPSNPRVANLRGVISNRHAVVLEQLGSLDKVSHELDASLRQYTELAASDPNNHENRNNLESAIRRKGMLALRTGKLDVAYRLLANSQRICFELNWDGTHNCTLYDQAFGRIAAHNGNFVEAEELLKQALEKTQGLERHFPADKRFIRDRAVINRELGDLELLRSPEKAQALYQSGLALLDALLTTTPNHPGLLVEKARCLVRLGDGLLLEKKNAEATRLYQEALRVQRPLTEPAMTWAARKVERVETHLRLAFVARQRQAMEDMRKELDNAGRILRALDNAGLLSLDSTTHRVKVLLSSFAKIARDDASELVRPYCDLALAATPRVGSC